MQEGEAESRFGKADPHIEILHSRHKLLQDIGSVQRRKWNQVENTKSRIHHRRIITEQIECLHQLRSSVSETENQSASQYRKKGKDKIHHRTRQRDKNDSLPPVPVIPGVDPYRLRPAHMKKEEAERPDKIQMPKRIELMRPSTLGVGSPRRSDIHP